MSRRFYGPPFLWAHSEYKISERKTKRYQKANNIIDEKLIYFLRQPTFSCTRDKSQKFPYVVNPNPVGFIQRTVYDWITDENLTLKGNDLSKSVLSNVHSTWLRRKLKPLVQSRGEDSITVITSYPFLSLSHG